MPFYGSASGFVYFDWVWFGSNSCLQEGHEHDVSHEDAVIDVEFGIHYSGKRSRLVFHDQNDVIEFLCLYGVSWEPIK